MSLATADIHVKVTPELKASSEEVLSEIGISMSDLVNMTLKKLTRDRRIPFATNIDREALPENLRVDSEAEMVAHLRRGLEMDDGRRYTEADLRREICEAS